MTPRESELLNRLKSNPQVFGGLPILVGPMRHVLLNGTPEAGPQQDIAAVFGILGQLSLGTTNVEIKSNIPWITDDDIEACKLWWRKMVAVADTETVKAYWVDGERIDPGDVQQIME
jgi:uncharacterized protein (DUF433 family)